jgi:hypothetical protein
VLGSRIRELASGNGSVLFAVKLCQGVGFVGSLHIVLDEEFTMSDEFLFGFFRRWLEQRVVVLLFHTSHLVSIAAESNGFVLVPIRKSTMIVADDQISRRA